LLPKYGTRLDGTRQDGTRTPPPRVLTGDPVHSNALHPSNSIGDHVFPPGLIALGSADGAQSHVYPVDGIVLCKRKIGMRGEGGEGSE